MTTPKIDTEEVAGESMKGVIWINRWKAQRMNDLEDVEDGEDGEDGATDPK